MKNTFKNFILPALFMVGITAFKNDEGGSIKGIITPSNGAVQVWAISSQDTIKAVLNQGSFEIINVKTGTYKVYIDAAEPYKDVVKDNVVVHEGLPTDLGEIHLQR